MICICSVSLGLVRRSGDEGLEEGLWNGWGEGSAILERWRWRGGEMDGEGDNRDYKGDVEDKIWRMRAVEEVHAVRKGFA